ncbi:dipeptidyl peptidase 1-like [Homarus americanus]|uniref:dipeptidyl peptidase 1-like n=1 Tax=Homarus americanus TaxID=6706 RepID=UPI001C44E7E8|nr:dipeptidyl peptidase 1-like [Homarus americanus]
MLAIFLLVTGGAATLALAHTPGSCMYEEILGTWIFRETERTGDHTLDCQELGTIVHTKTFTLNFPDTATDELGNRGSWTMIANQGFEVNINERSYFAFSYYESDGNTTISYCDRTMTGWSRDTTVRNWSCFRGHKTSKVAPRVREIQVLMSADERYKNDHHLVAKINAAQTSWTAKVYPEFEKYTVEEMYRRGGGVRPIATHTRPFPAPTTPRQKVVIASLPENFDWRNASGVNYISEVRDQGSCGSCYAFASMANLEAQVRITTRNRRQDVFSTQDIVSCTSLAQGCNGGYDYLIAGRYGQDQGVVAEDCNPYTGNEDPCATNTSCARMYVSEYVHVGGYYGACNEATMLEALVTSGPVSVSFEVYDDFRHYTGGIYHHTGLTRDFHPFEMTNHVVLVVGYGIEEGTGEAFWIVKNSWGKTWGEDGFFRIRRGNDECAIESLAVKVTIIP